MTREEWIQFFLDNEETFLNCYRSGYDMVRLVGDRLGKQRETWDFQHGCSKLCFIDRNSNLAIKWCNSTHYNEMKKECEMYKLAVERGIECFFPKTELLVQVGDVGVYVQELVQLQMCNVRYEKKKEWNTKHSTVTDKIIEKAGRGMYSRPDYTWLRMAISYYGKRRIRELGKLTKEYKINDLHDANIGFMGRELRPVLLDFSGYRRDSNYSTETNTNTSW